MRDDECFDWGNSRENCHDLQVDYIWKFGRGLSLGRFKFSESDFPADGDAVQEARMTQRRSRMTWIIDFIGKHYI